jgi:hypothetical protein
MEADAQFSRALAHISALPGTPALRREAIKLQVGVGNARMHIKGFAAPETIASFDQARLLIENAEALGEPLEDPQLLFAVLYGRLKPLFHTAFAPTHENRASRSCGRRGGVV